MCKTVPPIVKNLEKRRQIKVVKTRESRETQERQKKFKREPGADRYYGPQSQKPDLSSDKIQQLQQNHLQKLLENAINWQKIEFDTRKQSESELWLSLRREMLTASNFGTICRMRPTTSCAATVKAILYPSFIDTAATKYGRENEEVARKELAIQLNKEIKPCGLFIDTENPCLGASLTDLLMIMVSLKKKIHKMNRKHRYYYQIQGQLNITQREYCIFAVWTPKSMKILRIDKDNIFWRNEINLRRYNKHMPIRNPKYIMEAKEEAAKKLRSQSRRNITESKNGMEDSKRFKSNVSPMEVTMTDTVTIALNEEQDDDCIIISHSSKRDITEEDMTRHKNVLDHTFPSFSSVKIETSFFETQSVLYLEYPHIIVASDKSVQIIGGNCSNYWRCIFFDGIKFRVYDSLPGCTYDKLVAKEKSYIHLRYPTVSSSDIIFEKVETQPDGTSCGIYAAAFATTVVLGGNPCKEKYSKNVKCMRKHFWKIIEDNKLLLFPK
ncbi:hypothetical protein ACFW04_012961 [Cataglyphis niger]